MTGLFINIEEGRKAKMQPSMKLGGHSARAEFVRQACAALGLPIPHITSKPSHIDDGSPLQRQAKRSKMWSSTDIPLPVPLARDKLWTRDLDRTQIEFIVDSLTLANITNSVAAVSIEFYRQPLDRIWNKLLNLYRVLSNTKPHF